MNTVIRTHEAGSGPKVGATKTVTAMPADIEVAARLSFAVAPEDYGVFPHIGSDEVSRIRELALVAQEQPTPLEDLFHLLLEDVRVHVNLPADRPPLRVDVRPD